MVPSSSIYKQAGCHEGYFVLDIGFRDFKELKELAFIVGPSGKVLGIDIEPSHVQKASKEIVNSSFTNIAVKEGSILSIPATDQVFDLIFCKGILHEVKQLDQAIGEMARVCKEDGTISIIDMQKFSRIKFKLYLFLTRLKRVECHDVHPGFAQDKLLELLDKYKLKELSYQQLPYKWDLGFNKVDIFLLKAKPVVRS